MWKSIKVCSAWHLGFVAEWGCHSYNSVSPALRALRVRDRSGGNHIRAEPHGARWIRSTSTDTTSAHYTRPRVCNWGKKKVSKCGTAVPLSPLSHALWEHCLSLLCPQGVLRIHLVEAQSLIAKDNFMGGMVKGKSDPYVKIRVAGITYRSHTIKENLNPTWNELYEVSTFVKYMVLPLICWNCEA